MYKVLVVDDDQRVYEIVRKIIPWKKYDMQVEAWAPNGVKAIQWLKENSADILLVDLSMPHMGGLELIRRVYEYLPQTVFVVLSSHSEYRLVKESFCAGAVDYLLKVDVDDEEVTDELLKRVGRKLQILKKSGERKFDWAALTAKLEIEEKIGYWYAVGVIRPEKEVDRLKIAEYLHTVSERESIVYGYCEGHLVMLAYAQNKGEAEQILVRVSQKAAYMNGIIVLGKSRVGPWIEIEKLYMEAVRNSDDGFYIVREYLMKNYSNPELTLQMVADAIQMNKRMVSKYVQDHTGSMFKNYLNTIRIEKAKEKLKKTNMRIQEIAYDCGYMNVEHFNRIFKEKVGCAPSNYEK